MIILAANSFLFIFGFFMVYDLDNIGWIFAVSYCVVGSMNTSNFVLSQTMLHGALKKESRASVLSVQGLVGSLAMILQAKIVPYIYDNYSHQWAFIVCFIFVFIYYITLLIYHMRVKNKD